MRAVIVVSDPFALPFAPSSGGTRHRRCRRFAVCSRVRSDCLRSLKRIQSGGSEHNSHSFVALSVTPAHVRPSQGITRKAIDAPISAAVDCWPGGILGGPSSVGLRRVITPTSTLFVGWEFTFRPSVVVLLRTPFVPLAFARGHVGVGELVCH